MTWIGIEHKVRLPINTERELIRIRKKKLYVTGNKQTNHFILLNTYLEQINLQKFLPNFKTLCYFQRKRGVNQFPAKKFLRLVGKKKNSKFCDWCYWLHDLPSMNTWSHISSVLTMLPSIYCSNNSYINCRCQNSNSTPHKSIPIIKSVPIILSNFSFTPW
jgi:hypothetical protein